MKKLITIIISICLVVIFASCELNKDVQSNTTPINATKKAEPKDIKVTIDKSNFNNYSNSILQAINSSLKNEKDLDSTAKNDIQDYLNKYHSGDFYAGKLSSNDTHKSEVVFLTSISLKYFFQAKDEKDEQKIETQKKILNDLLAEYSF